MICKEMESSRRRSLRLIGISPSPNNINNTPDPPKIKSRSKNKYKPKSTYSSSSICGSKSSNFENTNTNTNTKECKPISVIHFPSPTISVPIINSSPSHIGCPCSVVRSNKTVHTPTSSGLLQRNKSSFLFSPFHTPTKHEIELKRNSYVFDKWGFVLKNFSGDIISETPKIKKRGRPPKKYGKRQTKGKLTSSGSGGKRSAFVSSNDIAVEYDKKSETLNERNNEKSVHSMWNDILKSEGSDNLDQNETMRKLVENGIPDDLRGKAWIFLSNSLNVKKKYYPNYYETLLEYNSHYSNNIVLDVGRCFPDHQLFCCQDGTAQLFDVLKAYSIADPDVGYCQGMSFIVGVLLMYLKPEDAFWVLISLMEKDMMGYYLPSMPQLIEDCDIFDRVLKRENKELYQHLLENGVNCMSFICPWFMTLFTHLCNWETVLRVWDLFFFEGASVLFRIALAILKICEDDLLRLKGLEHILPFLLRVPCDKLDPSALISCAVDIPVHSLVEDLFSERECSIKKDNTGSQKRKRDEEYISVGSPPKRIRTYELKDRSPLHETMNQKGFFKRFVDILSPARPRLFSQKSNTKERQSLNESRKNHISVSKPAPPSMECKQKRGPHLGLISSKIKNKFLSRLIHEWQSYEQSPMQSRQKDCEIVEASKIENITPDRSKKKVSSFDSPSVFYRTPILRQRPGRLWTERWKLWSENKL